MASFFQGTESDRMSALAVDREKNSMWMTPHRNVVPEEIKIPVVKRSHSTVALNSDVILAIDEKTFVSTALSRRETTILPTTVRVSQQGPDSFGRDRSGAYQAFESIIYCMNKRGAVKWWDPQTTNSGLVFQSVAAADSLGRTNDRMAVDGGEGDDGREMKGGDGDDSGDGGDGSEEVRAAAREIRTMRVRDGVLTRTTATRVDFVDLFRSTQTRDVPAPRSVTYHANTSSDSETEIDPIVDATANRDALAVTYMSGRIRLYERFASSTSPNESKEGEGAIKNDIRFVRDATLPTNDRDVGTLSERKHQLLTKVIDIIIMGSDVVVATNKSVFVTAPGRACDSIMSARGRPQQIERVGARLIVLTVPWDRPAGVTGTEATVVSFAARAYKRVPAIIASARFSTKTQVRMQIQDDILWVFGMGRPRMRLFHGTIRTFPTLAFRFDMSREGRDGDHTSVTANANTKNTPPPNTLR
jgi:hypothetical protein